MNCLVCDNNITINTLKNLFSPQPPLLCHPCEQHLKPKPGNVLFKKNEWLENVIHRLNQGDIVLIQLFKVQMKSVLQGINAKSGHISIVEYSDELPYPWLKILITDVLGDCDQRKNSTAEPLVIRVVAQKKRSHEIAII
ncbi:MAG: hypothetical protein FWE07_05870 [Turicibacter sp.]|nr:hypothetical protein [Turicibacter sp.]